MKFILLMVFFSFGCASEKVKEQKVAKSEEKSSVMIEKSSEDELEMQKTCELESDRRVIQKWIHKSGSCYVSYEKFGKKSEVAKAKYNKDYCQEIFDRIASKLEASNFKCSN